MFHTGFNNKRQNGGLRSDSMSQNTGRSSVQRPQAKSVPNIEKHVVPRHTKIIYRSNRASQDRPNARPLHSHSMQSNRYQMCKQTIAQADSKSHSPSHEYSVNQIKYDRRLSDPQIYKDTLRSQSFFNGK